MRWLDGTTDDGHESEQAPGAGDGQRPGVLHFMQSPTVRHE